jgi:hypothetical protein
MLFIPLFLSSLFLLWYYLSKPAHFAMSALLMLIEIASWVVILVFLAFTTFFFLLPGISRIAVFCFYFLLASLFCLPLVRLRPTVLEQRLKRLPEGVSWGVLVGIVALTGSFLIANHFVQFRFIDGPYPSSPG